VKQVPVYQARKASRVRRASKAQLVQVHQALKVS
jgi:hypothetical protein